MHRPIVDRMFMHSGSPEMSRGAQLRAALFPRYQPLVCEAGGYLLELSLTIIGVAFFIVGLSDVSRIFHARGAVRAGVSEGLRCLYPTDAGCASVSLSNADIGGPRYNVRVWGSGGTILPRSQYLIMAPMFNEPVLQASYNSRKLQSVQVSQPNDSFSQHAVLYPALAHAPYLLTVRDLPRIGGGPLDPKFFDRYTNARIAPNQTLSIQGVVRSGERAVPNAARGQDEYDKGFYIGSSSFVVSGAWPQAFTDAPVMAAIRQTYGRSVPCYEGALASGGTTPRIQWPTSGPPAACSYRSQLLSAESLRVPIMIRVSGNPTGMSDEAQGKIVVTLSWTGSEKTYRLGGSVFTGKGSGNLIVRGMAQSDIKTGARSAYKNHYENEVRLHGTLPLIPLNARVLLKFYLSSVDGDVVGWQGGSVEVFHPIYQFVRETYECGYTETPATCANPPGNVQMLYSTLNSTQSLRSKSLGSSLCKRDAPAPLEESELSVLGRVQQEIASGSQPQPYSFWLTSSEASTSCAPQSNVYECNDTAREYMSGCSAPTYSQDYIQEHCVISDFRASMDSIESVGYDDKTEIRTEQRGGCSNEAWPACANTQTVGEQFFGTSSGSCGSALNRSAPQNSEGPLFDNLCTNVLENLKTKYREKYHVPANVPIVGIQMAAEPIAAGGRRIDPCINSYSAPDGDSTLVLCGQGVTRLGAQKCCDANGGRCIREEIPNSGGSGNSGVVRTVLNSAINRVQSTVQTAYPAAEAADACVEGDSNCLRVDANLVNDNTTAAIRAQMRVPLALSSLVGGSGATVEYEESRILERALMASSR